MDPTPDAAIDALRAHGLDSLPPLAIVLGSGLGAFADEARDAIAISYLDIPGFPVPSVEGHAGRLVVGTIEGQRVALFQGRGHYYERGDANAMRIAIETFPPTRRRDVAAHQRRGRAQNGMAAARAGRDHRSHQLFRNEPADRSCSARIVSCR